jgi:hypothetical protein
MAARLSSAGSASICNSQAVLIMCDVKLLCA